MIRIRIRKTRTTINNNHNSINTKNNNVSHNNDDCHGNDNDSGNHIRLTDGDDNENDSDSSAGGHHRNRRKTVGPQARRHHARVTNKKMHSILLHEEVWGGVFWRQRARQCPDLENLSNIYRKSTHLTAD